MQLSYRYSIRLNSGDVMHGIQLLSLAVTLTVLGKVRGQSPLSGKCKTDNMKPIILDAKLVPGKWNIEYVTDTERGRELDHAYVVITPTGHNTFNLAATKVLVNNKTNTRDFKLTLDNNILISEFEQDGKVNQYKMHPLACTNESAILLYHCSDTGAFPFDVRFIEVREGSTLSDKVRKILLDADNSYNFTGDLYKLPNELK